MNPTKEEELWTLDSVLIVPPPRLLELFFFLSNSQIVSYVSHSCPRSHHTKCQPDFTTNSPYNSDQPSQTTDRNKKNLAATNIIIQLK